MTDVKKVSLKKEKTVIQEFEGQVKDIRQQFTEQLRCLETRTDVEVALLSEIQDFFKRRAEVELEYSRSLEKLAKQIWAKHKAEKQKRESWTLFSLHSWWQQMINETKNEARYRSVVADIYAHHVATKMASQADELQRIWKRCREIGAAAHQEILRVLGELHTALKTYQLCYAAGCVAETKFRTIESQKTRFEEAFPKKVGNRKHRILEREFEKKQAKYLEFKLKALKARNEYLLCIDAANAALHKYFADDLSDLIDCMDVGMEQWLRSLVTTILEARHSIVDMEKKHADASRSWLQDVDARSDKRRFLEANHSTFMLPRKFEFRPHSGDEMRRVSALKPVQEELTQRYGQLQRRLRELKTENEEIWKTYATAERKLMEIQRQPEIKIQEMFNPPSPPPHSAASTSHVLSNYSSITGTMSTTVSGTMNNNEPTTPRRHSCRELESAQQKRKMDLCEMEEYLLQKFHQYLLTCNLIHRLEARHDAIQSSLGISPPPNGSSPSISNGHECYSGYGVIRDESWHSLASSAITENAAMVGAGEITGSTTALLCSSTITQQSHAPSVAPKPRKKRVGQTGKDNHRPRLFGGSLEEYIEATGEEIPLIIRSCVRYLSLFGLHHQGVFRVSGSQIEINAFKDAFERGEDPLADVADASDVNCVAGVLKLYFRELREPLFPIFMFDQFVDCTRCDTKQEAVQKIKDLVRTLPRPFFIVMRYLFAFLNHLSEFSDENMMDPYNLAICFGPTLLPIPESRDQVFFHNHVNELVKNMIVFHEEIFSKDDMLGGIVYEKYLLTDSATGDITNDEDDGVDDDVIGDVIGQQGLSCSQEDLVRSIAHPESTPKLPVSGTILLSTATTASEPNVEGDNVDAVRTHSHLNLSGEISLKDTDSPEQGSEPPPEVERAYQSVWLRRADSGRSKVNGQHPKDEAVISEIVPENGSRPQMPAELGQYCGHGPSVIVANDSVRRTVTNAPRIRRLPSSDNPDSEMTSSGPSSCSNSPREFGSAPTSAGVPAPAPSLMFKVPPPPAASYGSSRSYTTAPGNVGGAPLTAATISSSMAYTRHGGPMGASLESPKANRRDGVGIKRLSLSSYGIPITTIGETHLHPASPSTLPIDEECCYKYPDSELVRPAYHQGQQPRGLSPSSLKEIQVELKAVLNSLETFTMQQQTRLNCGSTKETPFILSSPDALVVSSPISPPDLVQNLPSPKDDAASPTAVGSIRTTMPSDNSLGNLSSAAERFAENKENTLKKGLPPAPLSSQQRKPLVCEPISGIGAMTSKTKPPVPKKPIAGQFRPNMSPQTSCRRRPSNDSSDEYGDDAVL